MSSRRSEVGKFVDKMIKKKVRFCKSEIEALVCMYRCLSCNGEKLDRTKFRDFLHEKFKMTDDIIMDRVFKAFDSDNESYITQEKFVLGMSTFLEGKLEEQMKFCFCVYDMNADGYISKDEMYHMLKTCLVKHPTDEEAEEGTKDLVELVLKKMDCDHDNKVSFDDYKQTVMKESLLLEAFGPCLPSFASKEAFKAHLNSNMQHM